MITWYKTDRALRYNLSTTILYPYYYYHGKGFPLRSLVRAISVPFYFLVSLETQTVFAFTKALTFFLGMGQNTSPPI